MSDAGRTRARETAEFRREFTLSEDQRRRLLVAVEFDRLRLDGARTQGNRVWMALGDELGFVWTTVQEVDDVAVTGRFTAEVPEMPARDDAAFTAWLGAAYGDRAANPVQDYADGDMADAWHAGREAGILARDLGRLGEVGSMGLDMYGALRLRQDADRRARERWQAGEPDPHVRELLDAAVAALDGCHGGADVIKGFARLRAATRALPATWREPAEKRELMWPDHADLVCWLLAKVEAMETAPVEPSIAEAEAMEDRLDNAGLLGCSKATASDAADVIEGLVAVIQAQTRKIASLRLQGGGPTEGLSPTAKYALAGLDRFTGGGGPLTEAEAVTAAAALRARRVRGWDLAAKPSLHANVVRESDGSCWREVSEAEWDKYQAGAGLEARIDAWRRSRQIGNCCHRWPEVEHEVGDLMLCELCGKRGMLVGPGVAGDAIAKAAAALPVRRSSPRP